MSFASSAKRQTTIHTPDGKQTLASRHRTMQGLGARPRDLEAFGKMGPLEQRQQIRDGMAAIIVERVAHELLHVPRRTLINALGLPASTIFRKISKAARLSAAESDRVARVIYIFGQALEVFEDEATAAKWILRPNIELAGVRPLEVLDTQPGYDRARDLLARLTFGLAV